MTPTDTYIRDISKIPLLTRDEEAELGRRCLAGDEAARWDLARHNLRLVVNIARKYLDDNPGELDDIIEWGNLGLYRATETYDPSIGKFSTYAYPWIRQHIQRFFLEEPGLVHAPAYTFDIKAKLDRGVPLSDQESSLWAKVGRQALAAMAARSSGPTPFVRDGDPGDYLAETLADDEAEPAFDPEAVAWVKKRLKSLKPRDRQIVWERVGLDIDLQVIGDKHGITRERVRQIVEQSLMKLQRSMPDWMLELAEIPVRPVMVPHAYMEQYRPSARRSAS